MLAQRLQIVLAEIVVLIQHGDLGVRSILQYVLCIAGGSGLLTRQKCHRPWIGLRIAPLHAGRGDEQLRNVLRVEIFERSRVGRRPERAEQKQDLVGLDQLARLLDRPRRTVAVVQRKQADLASVDAALLIEHLEIGRLGPADGAERGERAAVRHGLSDLDLGVGHAGAVSLLGVRGSAREQACEHKQRSDAFARVCSGGEAASDIIERSLLEA